MNAIAIQIAHPDGRTERRPLADGSYHVGRESAEIILPDPDVSARHARLDVRGGTVSVTDLGSTNGTLDGSGNRISFGHPLHPNQSIQLGRSRISLVPPAGSPEPRRGSTRAMPQFAPVPAPIAPTAPANAVATVPAKILPSTRPKAVREERKAGLFSSAMEVSRGTVTNIESWTTTSTSSTTTYGANGTSSTSYYVTSHRWQRIWYQTDTGRDVSWTFKDAAIDVLPGHRARVIYDKATNQALRFVNGSTRYYWSIDIARRGAVYRFFARFFAVIGAAFLMLPVFNFFAAIMWLRDAFGRRGRWYSGLLVKALSLSFLVAMLGSYTWALPLTALIAPKSQPYMMPVEATAAIETTYARIVASDLFAWIAPMAGATDNQLASLKREANLKLRDAAWLSSEEYIAKYRLQPISVASERFAAGIGVPVSVLSSLVAFAICVLLFQIKLTMQYWFARALDKRSIEEM